MPVTCARTGIRNYLPKPHTLPDRWQHEKTFKNVENSEKKFLLFPLPFTCCGVLLTHDRIE